jgi:two-component system, OmpR family, response regulator
MSARRILLVDDEARIREVVEVALQREGLTVRTAADGAAARLAFKEGAFDLVILDVMLPDTDGLTLCRELRQKHKKPVLFLTARGDEIDRVLGLELGGDDYVVKPFSPRELVARVKALLRRAYDSEPDAPREVLVHGDIRIELSRHEVTVRGQIVVLTPTELGTLAALLERPGIVLTRGQLMQRAYAWDNLVTERTIDTHVRRIRAKFRVFDVDPIATVHGVGYKAG